MRCDDDDDGVSHVLLLLRMLDKNFVSGERKRGLIRMGRLQRPTRLVGLGLILYVCSFATLFQLCYYYRFGAIFPFRGGCKFGSAVQWAGGKVARIA